MDETNRYLELLVEYMMRENGAGKKSLTPNDIIRISMFIRQDLARERKLKPTQENHNHF